MSNRPKVKKTAGPAATPPAAPAARPPRVLTESDVKNLSRIPASYQEIMDFFQPFTEANPFFLRKETQLKIEEITGRPLICYVCRTSNVQPGMPNFVDDSDLTGFQDLVTSTEGDCVDIFITSNGGSAEAAERIVNLLRTKFKDIRFIVTGNAYSAATLICLSGNQILISPTGTLGPIDPQINGIPARTILRAFETLEERLKIEGPKALTAYMPLIQKYDLHIFEICKSAQRLSEDLAKNWLSEYMLQCPKADPRISSIVEFLSDYDTHHSHGRGIDRVRARDLGLRVQLCEEMPELSELLRSLYNQFQMWFDKTPFIKMFENARGIAWGRQFQTLQIPIQQQQTPQPGPPSPSK